ncbi:uncharacterized protein ALTATR162_LOCUS2651 [Alternaria atra]|uniref:Heterokaryon incompatibility domain-containing protein n=1 Tax=Alternaria atra TaxID=119953 RepID=A0A8J2HXC6_9PLEO|nr:uncharacterized protein ALTATR162_LOCUS2651 [Alternaria atra]CAG5150414.1 unnamed protein product [Alternaria atra]
MEMPPKHVRFMHTPLNFKNKEIRLLTIDSSSDPSSPIQITLEHVDFSGHSDALARYHEEVAKLGGEYLISSDKRKAVYQRFTQETFHFIALSYTWGPEFPVHDILVTSPDCRGWLSIRQNLYEYLKIRRDCSSAWLWIDQICINQEKNDERAHQVNQMADIYSVATVEAWLGSGFKGSDKLVDLIVRESLFRNQKHPRQQFVSQRETRTILPSLHCFINLPYWSRLWVIQEILLGKVVNIRIGSKTLSWDTLFSGLERLDEAWKRLDDKDKKAGLRNYKGGAGARIFTIGLRRGEVPQDWFGVGGLVWDTQCSDLRDRVFGAMGMVRPSLRLFPDYSMHPQDILLMLLTKQVEFMFADLGKPGGWDDLIARRRRQTCMRTAANWLAQLEDDENRIDPESVRRHLFKILPLAPPGCEPVFKTLRTWRLQYKLWHTIPKKRSRW